MELGSRWSASASASVLMSSLWTMRLHLGLHPAVAVQRPVDAPRHQRLVVHPGDGRRDLARRLPARRAPAASRRAKRPLHGPARCRRCARQQRCRAGARGPAPGPPSRSGRSGSTLTCWPGFHGAGGDPAPEHAPALAGVGRGGELLDPLHREGEGFRGLGSRDVQLLQQLQQRQARGSRTSPDAAATTLWPFSAEIGTMARTAMPAAAGERVERAR